MLVNFSGCVILIYLVWTVPGILCNPNTTIKPRSTLTRKPNQLLTLTSPIAGLEKRNVYFNNQNQTLSRSSSNHNVTSSNHNPSSSNRSPSSKGQNETSRYHNPSFTSYTNHNGSSRNQKETSNNTKVFSENHTMDVTPTTSERYGRDTSHYDGIDLTQYEGIPLTKYENIDRTKYDGIDRSKYDVIDLTNFGVVDQSKYHMNLPKYVSTEATTYRQPQKILKKGAVNEQDETKHEAIDLTKLRRPQNKLVKDVEKEEDTSMYDGTGDVTNYGVNHLIKHSRTKPNRQDVVHGAKYHGLTDEGQGAAAMESYDVVYYEEVYEDEGGEVGYQDDEKSDRIYLYKKPPVSKVAPLKKLPPKRKVVVKPKRPKNKVRRKWKKPKPVIRRKIYNKNKYKQETTTEDYDQETTTTITTTTTSGYKGAVIALQPAYQIAKNKYHLGIASTFFPFLTGESVRGPIYAEIPLFSDYDYSSSCHHGGGFYNWFGSIFRRKLVKMGRVVRCK
uniref:Uncharacterized protein n=1 Tax=Cacopsylla melanoneura TaxID=428564 RepID=A0A8D8R160_9HEMI